MADAPVDQPMVISARELGAIGGRIGVRRPVCIAFHRDRGDRHRRAGGQFRFQRIILRLAFGQAQPPAIIVDDDRDMVGIDEGGRRPGEQSAGGGATPRGAVRCGVRCGVRGVRRGAAPDTRVTQATAPGGGGSDGACCVWVYACAFLVTNISAAPPLGFSGTETPATDTSYPG